QGSVHESWRYAKERSRRLGLFFRMVYRQEGSQHCVYLGKDPEFAAAVRRALKEMQDPLREQKELASLKAEARASLRKSKHALDEAANERVSKKFPHLAGAEQLAGNVPACEQLKVLVLGDCPRPEIALRLLVGVEVIEAWENLFFDVRKARAATDWIKVWVID